MSVESKPKTKLYWIREDKGPLVANVLGYATHNNMMKKYSEKYFDYTDTANIALNITPADHFVPIPGKFNILFTMWESLDIPESYKEALNKADLILVPCKFCKDIFARYTTKPIEICWEGIEPQSFPFHKREFPLVITEKGIFPKDGHRFRMLWVGAPNPRKGYYSILELVKIFEQLPHFEIYIKTTSFPKSTNREFMIINWRRFLKVCKFWNNSNIVRGEISAMKQSVERKFKPDVANKVQIMGKHKNIIVDTRKLPFDELVGLYNSAHVFLSPHMGEGWNLPLCEAMATGAPSVATGASGCMDFFNEDVGYPIKYDIKETELVNYDCKSRVFIPDTHDLLNRVFEVFRNYSAALKKGAKASTRIHDKFTWEKSASRLNDIIQKYCGEIA